MVKISLKIHKKSNSRRPLGNPKNPQLRIVDTSK